MWPIVLALGGVSSVVACLVLSILFSSDKVTMSNVFEVARQHFLYNAIGFKYNLDDIFKKGRNKFPLPGDLAGRVAVITGGGRGIGKEVVRSLLQCNMHVVIGCRKIEAGEKAVTEIRTAGIESGSTEIFELDVGSLESVRKFAETVLEKCPRINILLNNAGIMLVPYAETVDGHETQFGINYLGHFLLTHLLLSRLQSSVEGGSNSRIVNVSSCAHLGGVLDFEDLEMKKKYISSAAYARSKLAQIMFTKTLQHQLDSHGAHVQVHAVHPGVVNTELFNGTYLRRFMPWIPRLMFKSPEEGAVSVVYSALAPELEGRGGSYISNCGEENCSSEARNEAKQERLFSESCKMLNIQEFGKP